MPRDGLRWEVRVTGENSANIVVRPYTDDRKVFSQVPALV